MPQSVRMTQLARLLGRPDLLSLSKVPAERRTELERAVDDGFDRLVRALLEEAVASDDVLDAASADSFIEDRLAVLGDLLTQDQRARLREACRRATAGWE